MADDTNTLALDGELTIYRAAELKPTLLDALSAARGLTLSLAAVTEIDSAGVQLLIMLKQAALAGGRTLRLVAHSQAVLEVFELLDLGAYFGDPLLVDAVQGGGR
jgi:anti-sigma B factor antagonist